MHAISVIMGVYNGEKYIREAIESILNQTYKEFEFIICDDGSSDNTTKIINEYKEDDDRIVLIENKSNKGLAASLNRCLNYASGKYVARMDSDDVAIINRFEKQLQFLEKNPHFSFVGSGANLFDEKGIWGMRQPTPDLSRENIFKYHPVLHPTTMIRKEVLDIVNGYTVEAYTYRTEDYDLWCKIYWNGYVGTNLEEILLNYRLDKNSYKKRKFKYRIHEYQLKKIWRKKLDLPFFYSLYSFKPLIAGIIPSFLLTTYHKVKFKKSDSSRSS